MAQLLWRNEILASIGGRGSSRCTTIAWARENMALKDLRPHVVNALRERVLNKWEEAFWKRYDALASPITEVAA
jgi:hypothetical protein